MKLWSESWADGERIDVVRVDEGRVGPKGLAMRCGKCGNTFRLARDGTVTKAAVSRSSGIPTPGLATPLATRPSLPAPQSGSTIPSTCSRP